MLPGAKPAQTAQDAEKEPKKAIRDILAHYHGKVQNKQINHCHEKQLGTVNNQRDAHLTYLLMAAQLFVT